MVTQGFSFFKFSEAACNVNLLKTWTARLTVKKALKIQQAGKASFPRT